jgi:hypothetical protein
MLVSTVNSAEPEFFDGDRCAIVGSAPCAQQLRAQTNGEESAPSKGCNAPSGFGVGLSGCCYLRHTFIRAGVMKD